MPGTVHETFSNGYVSGQSRSQLSEILQLIDAFGGFLGKALGAFPSKLFNVLRAGRLGPWKKKVKERKTISWF